MDIEHLKISVTRPSKRRAPLTQRSSVTARKNRLLVAMQVETLKKQRTVYFTGTVRTQGQNTDRFPSTGHLHVKQGT